MSRSFHLLSLILGMLLCSCGRDKGGNQVPPAISYEVYTTTGGEKEYPQDGIGEINRGLSGLIKRFTDSTEAHIAIFDWTDPRQQELPTKDVTFIINTLKAFCNFYHYAIGDLSVAVVAPVKTLIEKLDALKTDRSGH